MRRILERAKDLARIAAGSAQNLIDPPVVVLLYHRVAALERDPQQLAVTPENFRAHLAWLKAHYPVLRFEEDWRAARRPAVVLTFDDGYADNALAALPALEGAEAPATFFVSTADVGSRREFWWDELERCIDAAPAGAGPFSLRAGGATRSWPASSAPERAALYKALHPALKAMSAQARGEALAALRRWAGVDEHCRESHRLLSLEELGRLASSRHATIGAHSVNHVPLARLSVEAQRYEIETSRRQLEQWIGRPVDCFSYPFGGHADYDARTVELCRRAGFRKAAANRPGSWHRWDGDLEIHRRLVRNWGVDEFSSRVRAMFRQ